MKKSIVTLAVLSVALFAPVAHAETMKPGLWEFSSQMGGGGMPAISDAQRKQMEAMGVKLPAGAGAPMINRICITPEQAKKGVPSMDRDGQKCETTDVKTSGKTTSWKMACTGKRNATGQGTVTYHSDEHFSGETTINSPDVPMPISSKFDAKFVSADCPAKK